MSLKKLKENFDIIRYLEDRDIEISYGGDNVSEGWIGVKCIFCEDHANHLGIRLDSKNYSCWLGGCKGDIIALIQELEHVGFGAARYRLTEYQEDFTEDKKAEKIKRSYSSLLPKHFQSIERGKEPEAVKQYFKRRNFDLSLCQQYRLGYVAHGEYKLRLIAPVYLDRKLVSFQAIDVTGKAGVPYIDCPEDRAKTINKELLYGIDNVREQVIIVEGITDKWRMGTDSVALFGKNYTQEQLTLLYNKAKGKRIKVVLDADAKIKSLTFVKQLCHVFNDVELYYLDEGDPDSLIQEEIDRIKA